MPADLYYGSVGQFNFVRLIQQVKVIENRKQLSQVHWGGAGLAGDGESSRVSPPVDCGERRGR